MLKSFLFIASQCTGKTPRPLLGILSLLLPADHCREYSFSLLIPSLLCYFPPKSAFIIRVNVFCKLWAPLLNICIRKQILTPFLPSQTSYSFLILILCFLILCSCLCRLSHALSLVLYFPPS